MWLNLYYKNNTINVLFFGHHIVFSYDIKLKDEIMDNLQLKNIIFLDIDGVLNNSTTLDSVFGCVGIDDVLVKRLKKIVETTEAEIFLVSSWKYGWYKDAEQKQNQDIFANHLDTKLYQHGLKITDKVESDGDMLDERGKLIKGFLQTSKVKNFVILDDIVFDYISEGFENNLVLTYSKFGLTEEDVKKAIEILQRPSNDGV